MADLLVCHPDKIVKMLFQPKKADLAIGDMTVTTVRNNAIDFTMPFMKLGQHCFIISGIR